MSLFAAAEGLLVWKDNWVSFLDAMLQMQILSEAGRQLMLPTRIRSLRIDPVRHEEYVRNLKDGTRGTRVLHIIPYCYGINYQRSKLVGQPLCVT